MEPHQGDSEMRFLFGASVVLACLACGFVFTGCAVEKTSDTDTPGETTKVEVDVDTTPNQPLVDVNVHKEGAFERLGERMDEGAQELDAGLEKGAGKLGEAMQNAGQQLQENSEEAQRRRQTEEANKPIEVDVNINKP
jgi:hypothetical protein